MLTYAGGLEGLPQVRVGARGNAKREQERHLLAAINWYSVTCFTAALLLIYYGLTREQERHLLAAQFTCFTTDLLLIYERAREASAGGDELTYADVC